MGIENNTLIFEKGDRVSATPFIPYVDQTTFTGILKEPLQNGILHLDDQNAKYPTMAPTKILNTFPKVTCYVLEIDNAGKNTLCLLEKLPQ